MKNPFEKNDHKVLLAGIIIGAAAAGAAAYLLLTETGSEIRRQLASHAGKIRDAFVGAQPEPQPAATEETPAYLRHPKKSPKTDREALKHHEPLHEPGNDQHPDKQQS